MAGERNCVLKFKSICWRSGMIAICKGFQVRDIIENIKEIFCEGDLTVAMIRFLIGKVERLSLKVQILRNLSISVRSAQWFPPNFLVSRLSIDEHKSS